MLKTKNLTYLSILIILGLLVAILLIYLGRFFAGRINNSFQVDDSKVQSTGVSLDMATFKQIAPRLGLKP